ncbi:MAG: YfiR family protein [Planctomycetes bacterium]|nr:YfiR family protein [Planctomycetota bacterium]
MRQKGSKKLVFLFLALCLFAQIFAFKRCFGSVAHAAAPTKKASEYEIKAVYLYNFLLFASWPESDEEGNDDEGKVGDLCIGIVGKDPFGKSFSEIEGKVIKSLNKRLVVKRYGRYKKGLGLEGCKLLFVCSSEKGSLLEIIKELKESRTLTIADVEGFLKYGGMINLVKVKKKIRWEINRTPLKKANIRLSSQLLRSAVKIVEIPKLSEKDKESEIARRTRR